MPSRMVITKLHVVSTPTLNDAIAACQGDNDVNGTSYVVGSDWAMGQDSSAVSYLCAQRTRAASATTVILQRIHVWNSRSDCPESWTQLIAPRDGAVVCTKWAPATPHLLASFNYISDVDVSHERFYLDASPSWATLPVSAHIKSTNTLFAGVYLSVRYPSEPITDLRVLRPVSSIDACQDHLGVRWASVDNSDPDARVALCVLRASKVAALKVLASVTIESDASQPCRGATLSMTDTVLLCATWRPFIGTGPLVTDLVFVSSLDPHAAAAGAAALASGFTLLASSPLTISTNESVTTNLLVRSMRPPVYVPAPQDASIIAKPQLNATLVVQNTTSLSFKILQLADLHFTGEADFACNGPPSAIASNCTEQVMSQFIDDLLDLEKPDFVVFTGDNVDTRSARYRTAAVDAFTRSVDARKIPFAFVLGNHDDDGGFPGEKVFAAAMNKSSCYAQHGPLNVDGLGNYALSIHAPVPGLWGDVGETVFRLYFLDSHGFTNKTAYPLTDSKYGWIQPSQLAYYRAMAAENMAQTPALLFYHIPIPEYATTHFDEGEGNEPPCSATVNSHLLSTLADVGDVKATFVGHDHLNAYCAERDGVQLCYGGGAGFGLAYGDTNFQRRARVIEWRVDKTNYHEIRTWARFYGNLTEKQQSQVLFQRNHTYPNVADDSAIPTTGSSSNVAIVAGSSAAALVVALVAMVVYWWKTTQCPGKATKATKSTASAVVQPASVVEPLRVVDQAKDLELKDECGARASSSHYQ